MQKWFKHPIAKISLVIPILIGIFFVCFAIPGFNKLPSKTDQAPIVIVDQDQSQISSKISSNLKDNLPFKHISTNKSLEQTKTALKNRSAALAIVIPKNFSHQVMNKEVPQLKYYVNDSNGLLQNNMTAGLITRTSGSINQNIGNQKTTGMIAKTLAPQFKDQAKQQAMKAIMKDPKNAKKIQKQVESKTKEQVTLAANKMTKSLAKNVSTSVVHLNSMKSNYQYQMTPMFLEIGSYLGTMLMSVALGVLWIGSRSKLGKNKSFIYAQVNGIIGIIITPFFTISTLRAFLNFNLSTYWHLIFNQMLFGLSVLELSFLIVLLLIGLPSLVILFPLLISQVIAGGGIVPRYALNGFYQWISKNTPMYQGVYLTFNALFGSSSSAYLNSLWMISLVGLVGSIIVAWIVYQGHLGARMQTLLYPESK